MLFFGRKNKMVTLGNTQMSKEDAINEIKAKYKNAILTKELLKEAHRMEDDTFYPHPSIRTNDMKRVRFVNKTPFNKYGNMIEIMECKRVISRGLTQVQKYSDGGVHFAVGKEVDGIVAGYSIPRFEQNALHVALKDFIKKENYNEKLQAYEVNDVQEVIRAGVRWANGMWTVDVDEGRKAALLSFLNTWPKYKTKEYYDYEKGKCSWEDLLTSLLKLSDSMEHDGELNKLISTFVRNSQIDGKSEFGRFFDYSYRVLDNF